LYVQIFGRAISLDSSFTDDPADGILGLGWPSLAADSGVPFVQNVLAQFDQPLFTVWLDRFVLRNHFELLK
jgi:hypothetical protein